MMSQSEIERWVARVVQTVRSGSRQEDSRVELKRELPPPREAARRIAGHANATPSDAVLWIVGFSEKTGEVFPVAEDLAQWWQQVRAEFDEFPPPMTDMWAPLGPTESVLALVFGAERRPFVVKTHDEGVSREIPWRDGTRIRTAQRHELLALLDVSVLAPALEPRSAEITWRGTSASQVRADAYIAPTAPGRLIFPVHRCEGFVAWRAHRKPLVDLEPSPPPDGRDFKGSATIERTRSEILVSGPGMLHFAAQFHAGVPDPPSEIRLFLELKPPTGIGGVTLDLALVRAPSTGGAPMYRWRPGALKENG